ncbi:hypothetical protein ScPMuIL_006535 [Solemya velum]
MASLLCRASAGIIRRSLAVSGARASSSVGPPQDPHKGKIANPDVSMPDTLGHSVGPERYELLSKLSGIEDPFELNVKKRAKGTFDDPTLIPSITDIRRVGCICEEDAISINYMMLHKGEPKRCECGYWFKLVEFTSDI